MTASAQYSKTATDHTIRVGDIDIHYNEAGTGPALLCTHGGGPGANAWDNTKYALGHLAEHFRVIMMDLPGYGESQKDVSRHGQPVDIFLAKLQRDFLDLLGIERASLYGSSAFGASALRFGIDFPERTHKIVLQAYSPVRHSPPGPGIASLAEFAQNPTLENMQRMCEHFVPRPELRTRAFVSERFTAAMTAGHLGSREEFSAKHNSDLRPLLAHVDRPILLLWGAADAMIPVAGVVEALAVLPDARAHIWGAGTGHFVIYEHPEEFADILRDFLLR